MKSPAGVLKVFPSSALPLQDTESAVGVAAEENELGVPIAKVLFVLDGAVVETAVPWIDVELKNAAKAAELDVVDTDPFEQEETVLVTVLVRAVVPPTTFVSVTVLFPAYTVSVDEGPPGAVTVAANPSARSN